MPTVSIILPTHNRANLLLRSIGSVLSQTFANLECLVIDDASSDETEQLVKCLMERDSRLRYYRHETGKYAAGARNTGLKLARGWFVAYHDDDDEWLPTKLEKQIELFGNLPTDYGCVYCWADYYLDDGKVVRRHRPSLRGDVFSKTLVDNAIGCTPSLLLRRETAERVGMWNESIRTEEDNEYIIRLCRICKVDYVPEVLVKVHTAHGRHQVFALSGHDSTQRALDGIKARYELIKTERMKYKKQAAALEARIGNMYGRLGDRVGCIEYYLKSLKLAPLSWEPHHMLLSLMKWQIKSVVSFMSAKLL